MKYSAGTIIIDKAGPEKTVLCLRAYANWDFPKGELEKGEDLQSAAVRETAEETTLQQDYDYMLTGKVTPSITYGSGKKKKTAVYFLATRISTKEPALPINPELGKPENDEYRWIPMSELSFSLSKRFAPILNYLENIK